MIDPRFNVGNIVKQQQRWYENPENKEADQKTSAIQRKKKCIAPTYMLHDPGCMQKRCWPFRKIHSRSVERKQTVIVMPAQDMNKNA